MSNRVLRRGIAGAAAGAVTLGVLAGCTFGQEADAAGTAAGAGSIAVTPGDIPSQDVIALPGDRDALLEAALERLPELIEEDLAESGVPGLAIAVVSEGEVVYTGAFGERDTSTGEPVEEDTVFQIASMSKPLSATVVAKMVSDGDVTWDTPVRELLPGFELNDPYVTERGQIADYFSHRTGLPTGGGDDLEDIGYERDYIFDHLGMIPLDDFRSTYHYSNFGLTTGAVAAAAAVDLPWEDAAEQLLFEPLGMTSTSAVHDDYLAAENRAVLHARVDGEFEPLYDRNPDAQSPAGGVSSTVGDLAEWLKLVLAEGELDGEAYIESEALLPATAAQVVSSHTSDVTQRAGHYGYGFNVGSTVGGRVNLNHSGAFTLGGATNTTLVPDLDLGVVVLTNGTPVGLPESVSAQFLDLVQYGELTRDWLPLMSEFFIAVYSAPEGDLAGETAPSDAAPPAAAAEYAGTYTNDYFGDFVVTADGDTLTGALGPDGGYTFDLEPWDGDTWSFVPTGENAPPGSLSTATFTREGAGVASVTLGYFDKWGLGTWVRVD
jgi:CubicO group peptidase (beta-lactamase class C family)